MSVLVSKSSLGCVCVCVHIRVGLEALGRSFLVALRRAAVVEGKTPAQLGLNITG